MNEQSPRRFHITEDFNRSLLNLRQVESSSKRTLSYSGAARKIFFELETHGSAILQGATLSFPADRFFSLFGYCRFVDSQKRASVELMSSPFAKNISETTREGFFHTDYSAHRAPPAFTVIECKNADPRHPFYGRNQIAHADLVLQKLAQLDPSIVETLLTVSFPFLIGGQTYNIVPLFKARFGEKTVHCFRMHIGYIDTARLSDRHFFFDIPIHSLIEMVAMQVCQDFAIDTGEILLLSNVRCLHRRGAATVAFGKAPSEFVGRRIDTWRYTNEVAALNN